jgi:hypothetical protein
MGFVLLLIENYFDSQILVFLTYQADTNMTIEEMFYLLSKKGPSDFFGQFCDVAKLAINYWKI